MKTSFRFVSVLLLAFLSIPAFAANRARTFGYCSQAGKLKVSGLEASNEAMLAYPNCTVTVYYAGTDGPQTISSISKAGSTVTVELSGSAANLEQNATAVISGTPYDGTFQITGVTSTSPNATFTYTDTSPTGSGSAGTATIYPDLYSDNNGTVQGNPFAASSTGYWYFYADPGRYDTVLSGSGLASPFTLGDISTPHTPFANNSPLEWFNASGVLQSILNLDSSNNVTISSPGTVTISPSPSPEAAHLTVNPAGSANAAVQVNQGTASHGLQVNGDIIGDSTVTAQIIDDGGQVFNVKAYGAVGNSTTDDTAAFQAAWSAVKANGGIFYMPPSSGCYLIDTPLNFTNTNNHRIVIEGAGGIGPAVTGSSGEICGNTGGAVFDITMSYNIIFENVDVSAQVAGLTNPSLIGVLAGRNASGSAGQHNYFINCNFQMPLHTSGSVYSFGVYFYGEELCYFQGDSISADCPIFLGSSNIFNETSPYITFGTATTYSETMVSFYAMDLYSNGLQPAIYLYGVSDITISGSHSYNGSQASSYPSGLYNYAIYSGSNSYLENHDIRISTFRQEGYPGFMYVDGGLQNSSIQGTDAPSPTPTLHTAEFSGASSTVQDVDFNINDEMSTSTNFYYDATAGSPVGLWSLDTVHFSCGKENNCVDIPLGQGSGTGTAYWHDVTWSQSASNPTPVMDISVGATALPLTGSFDVPIQTVNANSCTTLSLVSASGQTTRAHVEISPQTWQNVLIQVSPGTNGFNPILCNPTAAGINTTYDVTPTFRVIQ